MSQLENCPKCGKLFLKGVRDICPECYKEDHERFQQVYDFVRKRENRAATMEEIVEATGVSEEDISRYIKDGRLSVTRLPNLGYRCESCGKMIRSGKLCDKCKESIEKGIEQADELARIKERNRLASKRQTTFRIQKGND